MTKLEPYEWQVEDQRVLRANGYTGLVAIEAGGGKSLTATLAIRDGSPSTTLIIAPKSTHHTAWIPTLADNAGVEARVIGNGKKAEREALMDFTLGYEGTYLVTPQFVTRHNFDGVSGDFIIHDESHQGASPGSKLQRKLGGFNNKDTDPLAHRFDARLALSGTPMRQNFENMFGTMRFLWGDRLNNRGQVAARNFVVWQNDRMDYETVYTARRDQFGAPVTVKQFLNESEPGRLLSEMPCAIQHKRREQCCPWHGPVQLEDGTWTKGGFLTVAEPQVIEREVILTAPQKKAVREMESMMLTYLKDQPLVTEISLTQKLRIRQLTLGEANAEETEDGKTTITFDKDCTSPAIEETLHIMDNLPEDEPVLILLESQRFAEVAVHQLTEAGYKAAEYSGVRKADLSAFGRDYRVLVGVISCIGTGTAGLNHITHTEIILEQPISLTNKTQSEARLERLDNKVPVQRYVLLDDLGVQTDRFLANVERQAMINRSLRKVA